MTTTSSILSMDYASIGSFSCSKFSGVDDENTVDQEFDESKLFSDNLITSNASGISMNRELIIKCGEIIKVLRTHEHSWVFDTPVDPIQWNIPDYFEVIENPMDLGTIQEKLDSGNYNILADFALDVRLTFRNAMMYHGEGHAMYDLAKTFLIQFLSDYQLLITDLEPDLSNVFGTMSIQDNDTPEMMTKQDKVPSTTFVLTPQSNMEKNISNSTINIEDEEVSMRKHVLKYYHAMSSISNIGVSGTTLSSVRERTNAINSEASSVSKAKSTSSSISKTIKIIRSSLGLKKLKKKKESEALSNQVIGDQVLSNRTVKTMDFMALIDEDAEGDDFPELKSLDNMSTTSDEMPRSVTSDNMSIASSIFSSPRSKLKIPFTNKQPKKIIEPTDNDIICERGERGNLHPGNQAYLKHVDECRDKYQSAKSSEKKEIARCVFQWVKDKQGRFLERKKKLGKADEWYEIDDDKARAKVVKKLGAKSRTKVNKRFGANK